MLTFRQPMKLLRTFALSLSLAAVPLAAATVTTDAQASVMIAVPFEALVKDADAVAVVVPEEAKSVWEDGRIYTYTKVRVDQGVAGDTAGQELWIRTMGGVVGKIGQLVDGEPVFTVNKPALLFLRKFKAGGTWEVSARAQGQFPVVLDEAKKTKRLVRSANVGMLLPPKSAPSQVEGQGPVAPQAQGAATDVTKIRLAGDVLHDRPLDDATKEIATTWKRLHAAPSTK